MGYFEKNGAKKKTPLGTGVPKTNVFMTKDLGIIAVIVILAMEDWEKFIKIFWYFCFVIIASKCYFWISGNRNLAEARE